MPPNRAPCVDNSTFPDTVCIKATVARTCLASLGLTRCQSNSPGSAGLECFCSGVPVGVGQPLTALYGPAKVMNL